MFHNLQSTQQSEDFDDGFSLISGCPDFFVRREGYHHQPSIIGTYSVLSNRALKADFALCLVAVLDISSLPKMPSILH